MKTEVNKWYVSTQNKAKGPYTDLQMRDQIMSGSLSADTLTYKEGEADWLPLEKQDIWTPGFTPKHGVESKDSKDWVLLVESPLKQGDYEQQGPFTQEEIGEKVEIGEVHLKDFCWRPGMSGWKPLVEAHELGFPRKDKITFKEKNANRQDEVINSKNFAKEKALKTKGMVAETNFSSEMPDFVAPENLKQVDDVKKVSVLSAFRTRLLPPLRDKEGERREVLVYLALVAALFMGAFYVGSQNSTKILKAIETMGIGVASFTQRILPVTPKVSYVFLRELPLSEGVLLIKTDAQPGVEITARLKDENGRTIKTVTGDSKIILKTNKNGEAFLGAPQFKVKSGETYLVTTKVGHLTAKKTYFYSKAR